MPDPRALGGSQAVLRLHGPIGRPTPHKPLPEPRACQAVLPIRYLAAGRVLESREFVSKVGVGDGYRTRDLLSHSQAFCH
jgi:hypothetical protein